MLKFLTLFPKKCSLIAMVHVEALPGTPLYGGSINKIISKSLKETEIYLKNNVDAIMIENMHDIPYIQSKHFGPEVTSVMTRVSTEISKLANQSNHKTPIGIQILACGNKEALAISKACDLNFIRSEGFVFGHIADEGFTDASAGQILRYRKQIEAENVLIFADIKKKHSSHAITSDVSLTDTSKAAAFFLADGVVLTGTATGDPVIVSDLSELKKECDLPVLVGSGVTFDNLEDYLCSDAIIVGSHFKDKGHWKGGVNEIRVSNFVKKLNDLRQ